MKFKKKILFNGLINVVFLFLLLTFIILIITIPRHLDISFDFSEMKIVSNVSFLEIKQNVTDYYKILLSGSLGETKRGTPAWTYIKVGFYRSLTLIIGSLIISIILGLAKGIFDSKRHKNKSPKLRIMFTLGFLSISNVTLIVLLQAFIIWLHRHGITLIPALGYKTFKHALTPMFAMSLILSAYIARIATIAIDEVYQQDYIKTALGKGASRGRILFVHVMRNAMVQIADSFSSIVSILISSLLIIECLFFYPGLTYFMSTAFNDGSIEVVVGISLIIGMIYLSFSLIFKGLRYVLNPHLRQER